MKAIGIDLGTTNSAASVYDQKRTEARMLAVSGGGNLTPSVVAEYSRDGSTQLLVGEGALNWAGARPQNAVVSVKRLMGRDFNDPKVKKAAEKFSYEVIDGPDEDPRAHVRFGGRTCTPAQVSSLILRSLAQGAQTTLGEEVTHAVITVPAHFGDAQRAATREAAEWAGLIVKKIIDEPTAAAIAFGLDKEPGERSSILVYDLGGGTFDISILKAVKDAEGRGHFLVQRFDGDDWLGGDDFDSAIVDRVAGWVREEYGLDPSGDKRFLFEAKKAAERAKRQLNEQNETFISIPAAYRHPDGRVVDVDMTLTREEFNGMIDPMVQQTMRLVRRSLEADDLTAKDISDVLLVGGSTLTRHVYETVEDFFGKEKVRRTINPMECVALGAGVLAGTLHGVECPNKECREVNEEAAAECRSCGRGLTEARMIGDTGLYEVTGRAMGISAVKGSQRDVFVPIIPGGTPYPLAEPKRRSFEATDSRWIRVPVYEGNSAVASENQEQGVIEFELPEEIGLHERVDVSFNYSLDRIVKVRISLPGSGISKEFSPNRNGPRTPAPSRQPDDAAGSVGPRQLLDQLLGDTGQFLVQYTEYIEPTQRMKVERDMEQAQRALDQGDSQEYRRLTDLLLTDMFHNCGLASSFKQADRAADGASAELSQQINDAIEHVRQAHATGNREQRTQQARNLNNLVARAMDERYVSQIPASEDYKGLLRLPDDEPGT
jgi:molecular chaperone DnaK